MWWDGTLFHGEGGRAATPALAAWYAAGRPVDLVTMTEELNRTGRMEGIGGLPYLTSLSRSMPSAANAQAYARIVEEKSVLRRMIRACEDAGVHYLQGHSKIYQAPMKAIRKVIRSGKLGRVVQIHAANFNDWLQRPRLAPEVDTIKGGGIVYRQGPHIVDIVRFIGGGMVDNVRGISGRADRHFDTEGHFSALLEFDNGATATITFNGYGYFDVTELTWGIGESGRVQTGARSFPRADKPRIKGPADPARKRAVAHDRDSAGGVKDEQHQPFFGLTVVFCEKGVIRQSPDGLYIYTQKGREEVPLPSGHGRGQELLELVDAIGQKRPAFPDGHWGKATLEVCLAIMASGRDGKVRRLKHQVPAP